MLHLGNSKFLDRAVYLLEVRDVRVFRVPPALFREPFACFLALDARNLPEESIYSLAQGLLEAGCIYFCAWGPDCERVHDIMDEALVGDNPPTSIKEGIMTTWHAEESLADATEYFFCLTLPDEHFVSECKTALILSGIADQMRELKNLVNRYLKTVPEEYGNGLI